MIASLAPPFDTSDRLAKMSLFYHREAKRCAANRAYLAACILTGAALEAILLSMCYIEDRAVRQTLIHKRKKFKAKRNRFLEFNLFQLIGVAAELEWIPAKEIQLKGRKTTLQELLHWARLTRNMLHPAVWTKEGGPQRVHKSTYDSVCEVFDVTREWMVHGVLASLARKMDHETISRRH